MCDKVHFRKRKYSNRVVVLRGLNPLTPIQQIRQEMCIYGGIVKIEKRGTKGEVDFLITYCHKTNAKRLLAKGMECDHGNFRPILLNK